MKYTNAADTASGTKPGQFQNRDSSVVNQQNQEQILNDTGDDMDDEDKDDESDLNQDDVEQDNDTTEDDEIRPDEGTDDSEKTKEKIPRMNM
ncbi:hypothetical protein BH11BAC6_BH11BAC6_02410 [soil metagenome]